jgi:hypothetical protein
MVAQLNPIWQDLRPDLTSSAPAVELHAFAGTATLAAVTLGEGQQARFVPVTEQPTWT